MTKKPKQDFIDSHVIVAGDVDDGFADQLKTAIKKEVLKASERIAAKADARSKTYFCEGSEAMLQLEDMVNTVGIRNVLYALQNICYRKGLSQTWETFLRVKQRGRE
jgi:hypothetical protein